MSKQLVIAEKPSVAQDITRALGGFSREKDYFESDDYVVSSAVGHLLELVVPDEFEVKRGKWTFGHLPVIPPHFTLKPIEKTQDRLKLLLRLLKRKDIDGIINACDAGREGELIFNFIVEHAKSTKPVRRLWLQSMTPAAIRDGFQRLRQASEVEGLRNAAVCRAESDWLIGINGTRAMTAFNSKSGGFHLTTVGRVQTPTLAIVVEREQRIRAFRPRDYWEVEAAFAADAGNYVGRWFDEAFRKTEGDEHANAYRLWDKSQAEAIVARCAGKTGVVEEDSRPSTQLSPLLFDLTSLQREANGRFGFSARTTLQLAQALYERHKVLTYPRTDSRALPEDYLDTVRRVLGELPAEYAPFARQIVDGGWLRPNKRIFNNSKISDHFAIIPTGAQAKSLSEAEQKIYDLVTRRFLAVFFPAAEYRVTTRITRIAQDAFKSEGKVLVAPGWLAIYGKEAEAGEGGEEGGRTLVPVAAGETVRTEEVALKTQQTRPPARFSEATLLSAMEGAGKMVDDEELRAAMGERGLGTPATRAQIIEGLIAEQYLFREGRELIPSSKAFSLITLLTGLGVSSLISPELTGEWEYKLARMERGELSREKFMQEIAAMARDMVERAKQYESDTVPGNFVTLAAPCPKCGGTVKENYKKFACQQCDWATWKVVAGRQFEIPEIEQLLATGRVGPLTGFRNRMGRLFNAEVQLNDDKMPEFDFGQPREGEGEAPDFSGQQSLGACPKCGAGVYEHGMAYVCEKAVGPQRSCDFRSGKVILQQPVPPEEMRKLLAEGKTSLLKDFVSQRTRRKFSAYLVRDASGKVGFEFEARTPKAGAAKKGTAKTGAKTAAKGSTAKTKSSKTASSAKTKTAATKTRARKTAAADDEVF